MGGDNGGKGRTTIKGTWTKPWWGVGSGEGGGDAWVGGDFRGERQMTVL